MADELQLLEPLPPPGIALFPHLIAKEPVTLRITGNFMGNRLEVTTMDGSQILLIERKIFSNSHRQYVVDAVTGVKLCTIRRRPWSWS